MVMRPLPAYQLNPMLDVSPVSRALSGYQQQMNVNDKMGMEQRQLDMREQEFASTNRQREADRIGRFADLYLNEADPARKAVLGQGLLKLHPQMGAKLQEAGIDASNPDLVARFLKAETSNFDPLGERAKKAQIAQSETQTANIGKTDTIREFEFAKRNGFQGSYQDWQTSQENRSTKYGLNPIPYQKPDGSIGYMVPSTSGQTKDLGIPGGGKAMPKAVTDQTPTEIITRDQFGNIIRREQKDIAGKEEQEQIGTSRGKAKVDLPAVEASAKSMTTALDRVETAITRNPRMVGGVTGVLPNVTASARDTQAKIDEVQGKVFLQAYQSLKGGGAITEVEGKKAEAAISRLQTAAVGSEAYFAAINDVRNEVNALVELARSKAGAGSRQPAASAPAGGGWGIRRLD